MDGLLLCVRDAKPSCPGGFRCVRAWRYVIQWGSGSRRVLAGCWDAYLWGIPFSKDHFIRTYLFLKGLGTQIRGGIYNLNNYPGLPPPILGAAVCANTSHLLGKVPFVLLSYLLCTLIPLTPLFSLQLSLWGNWEEYSRRGVWAFSGNRTGTLLWEKEKTVKEFLYYPSKARDNMSFLFGVVALKILPQRKRMKERIKTFFLHTWKEEQKIKTIID